MEENTKPIETILEVSQTDVDVSGISSASGKHFRNKVDITNDTTTVKNSSLRMDPNIHYYQLMICANFTVTFFIP